ncbi:TRAP transporter small permease subunit [Xanthobacteraceae bacterium Astr-EGSB]|uniref:TRAP transporter small permease n=1 Tax=Astrobacterium formosum TaxID=3069710 RepID=UPI0027B725A7|nr:TRAP transporter small permease subunit [Xanthobacteraceae bacterium Astr-EGSB]
MSDCAATPRPHRQPAEHGNAFASFLTNVLKVLGVAAFAVTLLATLAGVFARYLGLAHFEWTFEIAGIAFLWTTFLGVVIAEIKGENVAFTALTQKARGKPKRVLVALSRAALIVLGVYMLWSGFAVLARSGAVPTPVLRWPSAVSISALVVFAAAIIVVAVVQGIAALRVTSRRTGAQP